MKVIRWMGILSFLVAIAPLAFASPAGARLKLKGAEERKNPRQFQRDALTIDEVIRMEEDEGYEAWKREEERAEREREASVAEVLRDREAYEANLEKARLEYIRERDAAKGKRAQQEAERNKAFRLHLAEKRKRRQFQEEARVAFVRQQELERSKVEARTLARLQRIYGTNRRPASIQLEREVYRYPADRPKPPSHPIK